MGYSEGVWLHELVFRRSLVTCACTLGTYLSCHCSKVENSVLEKTGLSTMKVHVDLVFERLEELKSFLESDSHIYKLVASTLLYCCSVI
jgi:hypothetical protein